MLLTKVILKNYGVYRNENVFDFTCTPEKPIILIGGTNGSGKTTLFEAIMLCLYGISFFDKRTTQKQYEKHLANKIHRYLGSPASADYASIVVDFQFFHSGRVDNYTVDRTWRNEDGKIIEDLTIRKNGETLESVDESQWQSFIEELIPLGIIRLFFFDGERIVRIAEDGNEDIEFKSSFESLLGLDLVEQLQSDLTVYIMRHMKGNAKAIREEFDKLIDEKEEPLSEIYLFQAKLSQKNAELDAVNNEIRELENKVSKLGGGYATKREQLKIRKALLETRLATTENNIRTLCAGTLPFATIPHQLELVKKQLKTDECVLKKKFEKEILDESIEKINSYVNSEKFWSEFKIDFNTKKAISEKLTKIFSEKPESKREDIVGMFNFSTIEAANLINVIENVNNNATSLEKETDGFNKITEELEKIETALINAPNDDEIGPLITKLNEQHANLGTLNNEMGYLEQQISSKKAYIKMINKKLRDVVSEKNKNYTAEVQAQLTEKVQKVLQEYSEKLKTEKLRLLENYLLEGIKILMHKEDFIEKVSVDKESFDITLYTENEGPIPKDLLSKGEQQMLATAILLALAKTSGKPLPFMIDTPLARLDVKHRKNLIEKFFPTASHQVIIFSTNAEIDAEYYIKLLPYISRSYALEYIPVKGMTKKHEGYFWNEKGEKLVAV